MMQNEIRDCLLNRDFDRAQSLIREWGKDISAKLKSENAASERRRIFEEALALGEQSLYLARVVRAQIASELHSNSASFLYGETDLEQPRWRLNA